MSTKTTTNPKASPDQRTLKIHGQLRTLRIDKHQAGWIVWDLGNSRTHFGPCPTRKEARAWLASLADTEDPRAVIAALARRAADNWFFLQCRNTLESFYLYWREGALNQAGQLIVSTQSPGLGWHLASPERIKTSFTVEQAAYWMSEQAKSLPVLAWVSEVRG
jgi:hypothetical protein